MTELGRAGHRTALIAAVWLIAWASSLCAANRFAGQGHDKPNVLFLLSDDHTYRALGALGELEVKTPNLDRLAARGMLFTHCFNQGGWSGAVCIPSRAMLNTGRTLWQCRGPNGAEVDPKAALWGETFGKAGYNAFMAGKWHLTDAALSRSFKSTGPLTGGFLPSTDAQGAAYRRPAPGNPWSPADPIWKGHWLQAGGETIHSSVRIADSAIDFLRSATNQGAKPFFMYVAFNAPHDPRQSPSEFLAQYPAEKLAPPPNFLPQHPFLIERDFFGRDEILAPYPRTPQIVQIHLQEYYAIITHLDAQIGRILDALETSGMSDNTIVFFTSDQGLAVGQHGLMGKQNLYEHSLRVPFIVAGPGVPKNARTSALVYMQSVFATTCEMAGIRTPRSVQFPSLTPIIEGKKSRIQTAVYAGFLDRQRAIRTSDWKLIRSPIVGRTQLFDMRNDPWEMRDLADSPDHKDAVKKLDSQLRRLMADLHDPLRLPPLSLR